MRVRESNDEWFTVPFGSDAQPAPFAVGDTVVSDPYPERGTVAGVYATTMAIVWSDGDGGRIIYPLDTSFIRKLYPWEV